MAENIVSLPGAAAALPAAETIAVPLALVKAALQVAGKNDIRRHLNGVFVHAVAQQIRVVGTDGHRLLLAAAPASAQHAEWLTDGLILSREWLAEALALIARIEGENAVLHISFGRDHPQAELSDSRGRFRFRIDALPERYPDYSRVLAGNSGAMSGEARAALDSTTVNADYLKSAALVAAALGVKSTTPYIGDAEAAMMFTFGATVDAVLYIMPTKEETKASSATLALIGAGLLPSLAGCKAWRSRLISRLNVANTETQRAQLRARLADAERRIAELGELLNHQAPTALAA